MQTYVCTKARKWMFRALPVIGEAEKASPRRWHAVWFHLYTISEVTNHRGGRIGVCQSLMGSEAGRQRVWPYGATRGVPVPMESCCVLTVSVLKHWLWCGIRCYHWGNWVKGTWDPSALLLTYTYGTHNDLKTKQNKKFKKHRQKDCKKIYRKSHNGLQVCRHF